MIASRVTIFWKSYKPQYPLIITNDVYNYYKSQLREKLPPIRFKFWDEFYVEIIIIALGLLSVIAEIYRWYLKGGLIELLAGLFFIVAIVTALSFILSAISYIASYFKSKAYIIQLDKAIKNSKSYEEFCQLMSEIDKSYVMQIHRMNNETIK